MGKNPDTSGLKTYATLPEAAWDKITIAVETVTEDMALKRQLFAEMEKLGHRQSGGPTEKQAKHRVA